MSRSNPSKLRHRSTAREPSPQNRRGIVAVLAAMVLVLLFGFVAFAVDTGRITVTQTELQNAVDAAALAASQEITTAVQEAGEDGETISITSNSQAVADARTMAANVANANGVYVNAQTDVKFGSRKYNTSTSTWSVTWDQEPYNAVKVTANRTNADTTKPNGKLRLAFGWAVGRPTVDLSAHSTAFVESRDIVLVLDYSASMNDDSIFAAFSALGQGNVEANIDAIWQSLVDANPKFNGSTRSKFPSTGFGGINSKAGTYLSSNDKDTVYSSLNLNQTISGGAPKYPFPQVGKNSDGSEKGVPSTSTNATAWKNYIEYVQDLSGSYNKKYGYRTLMNYLMTQLPQTSKSEDLWRTPHYPANAVKNGATLFTDFLQDLDFGDEVGLVVYDTQSYKETSLASAGIDISTDPITANYDAVDTMQRHKQAGNVDGWTGMGYGIRDARELLASHARYGARPMMLVMTDGQTNQRPSGWSLPSGWSWSDYTDFDDDGDADYTSSDKNKQYAFWQAAQAIDAGMVIHTLSVGADADATLMQAIAQASGGVSIHVPGGQTIANVEAQVLEGFAAIASKIPPPKLVYDISN